MSQSTYPSQNISPDPLLEAEFADSAPEMDYASHLRTFRSVMSAARWFAIHVAILLVALYFFAIAGQPGLGTVLILFSIAVLAWGMLHRHSVRDDLVKGLRAHPGARHAHVVDHTPGSGDGS